MSSATLRVLTYKLVRTHLIATFVMTCVAPQLLTALRGSATQGMEAGEA